MDNKLSSRSVAEETMQTATNTDNIIGIVAQSPQAKKPKKGLLDDICISEQPADSERDDVKEYLTNFDHLTPNTNLLIYKKAKVEMWLNLSYIIRSHLGVHVASTNSKQNFSLAVRTLEDRCSQLDSNTVYDMMFLHGLH